MSYSKRIGMAVLALIIVVVIGAHFILRPRPSDFKLPDTPEKLQLAEQQAQCAGAYLILRTSLKQQNPNYQELERTYSAALERHTIMAQKLFFDLEKSQVKIERASHDFVKNIETAVARKADIKAIVDAKEAECIEVEFKTLAFIQRERKLYVENR